MSGDEIDLDAYLARIEYGGTLAPTVETLNAICLAHVTSIPFSNVDILMGRPVRLDARSLQRKIVVEGRGGYCYEQAGLVQRVLRRLGFEVAAIAARVRLEAPRPAIPPITHMALKVEVGGWSHLVDVGFGSLSLGAALRLAPDVEQATPQEPRRFLVEGARWFNQAFVGGEWREAHEFTLDEYHAADQEVANWWTSAHPTSRFVRRLSVARARPDGGRNTILDRRFTVRGADGVAVHHEIASSAELLGILDTHFGLRHPNGTHIDIPDAPWPDRATSHLPQVSTQRG